MECSLTFEGGVAYIFLLHVLLPGIIGMVDGHVKIKS